MTPKSPGEERRYGFSPRFGVQPIDALARRVAVSGNDGIHA